MELNQKSRRKSPFIPSLTEGDFSAGKLKEYWKVKEYIKNSSTTGR